MKHQHSPVVTIQIPSFLHMSCMNVSQKLSSELAFLSPFPPEVYRKPLRQHLHLHFLGIRGDVMSIASWHLD